MDAFLHFLESPTAERIFASLALIIIGGLLGWLGHKWRHFRLQRQIEQGDARDVATIEKILIDRDESGRETLRIRTCGRDPLEQIFPNPAARDAFHERTVATTPTNRLISMEGKMGSYLLQELAIWVCSQVGERSFPHDVWVMAVVCEPASFGGHQSSTVLLIRRDRPRQVPRVDDCRDLHVEHGGHGERILTLLSVADEFDRQSEVDRQAPGRGASAELRGDDVPARPRPRPEGRRPAEQGSAVVAVRGVAQGAGARVRPRAGGRGAGRGGRIRARVGSETIAGAKSSSRASPET